MGLQSPILSGEVLPPEPIFRINRFTVPAASRTEFMALMGDTLGVIRRQPGFVRDVVLENATGLGASSLMTLIEFAHQSVLPGVIEALAADDRAHGLDRPAELDRLGIRAENGLYSLLDI